MDKKEKDIFEHVAKTKEVCEQIMQAAEKGETIALVGYLGKQVDFEEIKGQYEKGEPMRMPSNQFRFVAGSLNILVAAKIHSTLREELQLLSNDFEDSFNGYGKLVRSILLDEMADKIKDKLGIDITESLKKCDECGDVDCDKHPLNPNNGNQN